MRIIWQTVRRIANEILGFKVFGTLLCHSNLNPMQDVCNGRGNLFLFPTVFCLNMQDGRQMSFREIMIILSKIHLFCRLAQ